MRQKKRKKNKKNPVVFLASLLIFAAGAGIFLYPAVSNLLAEYRQENVIKTYRAKVDQADQEELDAAWEEAETYNENLAGDPVHDPFVMGSGYVLPENYTSVLNMDGDGVMGYIDIPSIDVHLPIYHGTSEEVLENGAGHMDVTALPIGGLNRHSVISAHRGLPAAELFTRLDEMETGDKFYIHILDRILAYEVDQIQVIEPEELEFLTVEPEKDLVTLLTCTPYAVNTHRLLVRGTRIPYEETEVGTTEERISGSWFRDYLAAIAAGVIILIVLVTAVIRWRKKGRQNDRRRRKRRRKRAR